MILATIWISLKNIMLSERNQRQKTTYDSVHIKLLEKANCINRKYISGYLGATGGSWD